MESIWTLQDLENRAKRKAEQQNVAREKALAASWEKTQRAKQKAAASATTKERFQAKGGRVCKASGGSVKKSHFSPF